MSKQINLAASESLRGHYNLTWQAIKQQLNETKWGELTGVAQIKDFAELNRSGQPVSYNQLASYLEEARLSGADLSEIGLLTKEAISYFGLTSGTTSQATSNKTGKKIPYNTSMLQVFAESRQGYFECAAPYIKDVDTFLFANVCSSHHVDSFESIPCGYVSGILNSLYTKSVAKNQISIILDDHFSMEEHAQNFLKHMEGREHHLQVFSGVPAIILALLRQVLKLKNVETVSEIFPNLNILCYGGTQIEPLCPTIEELFGRKDIKYVSMYTSTEAPIGLPVSIEKRFSYRFHPKVLVSLKNDSSEKFFAPWEATPGSKYQVYITTLSGLVLYPIGDEIVLDEDLNFKVLGRAGYGLNLATEKIQGTFLSEEAQKAQKSFNVSFEHFFFCPKLNQNGVLSYELNIFTAQDVPTTEMASEMEGHFTDNFQDYRENRTQGSLERLTIKRHPSKQFHRLIEKKSRKGQYKAPHLFRTISAAQSFLKEIESC